MTRDNAFLELHASQCLSWLTSQLHEFSPLRGTRLDTFYVKAFAELTLVYVYLQQWQHPRLCRTLSTWRAFITEHCENPIFAQVPRKQPMLAYGYLLPYLMLRSNGYHSSYYEETLGQLKRRGNLFSQELVPYRSLDRAHALWKSGYTSEDPRWNTLYRATALGKCRSPLCFDDDATYSVTHTLFYITDFGNSPRPLTSKERQRIVALVECLLLHYWRVGFWDLVGELLTCLNCLASNNSPIYAGAATSFESAWQKDGSVPAKRELENQQKANGKVQEKEIDTNFRNCYHTTLVGVLYCVTAMNRMLEPIGE